MRQSSGEDEGRARLLQHYVRTAGAGLSRRRAQRTLGAAKIEAELANRAKTEFLANMSHELRTPLNAIIGFAELILHAPNAASQPEKLVEYGNHIASAGRRLLGTVSDILDIAQLDTGSCQVEIGPCDITRVMELSAAGAKERIAVKHQFLSVVVEDNLPELMLDRSRMQQALTNLLLNASKYSSEGGRLVLRGARNLTGGITIAVIDNGHGMSEQDLRVAISPFAFVQSAYARNDNGIALGVAIAKRLVELQGAVFEITSSCDEGTRAEITFLPACFAHANAPTERETP